MPGRAALLIVFIIVCHGSIRQSPCFSASAFGVYQNVDHMAKADVETFYENDHRHVHVPEHVHGEAATFKMPDSSLAHDLAHQRQHEEEEEEEKEEEEEEQSEEGRKSQEERGEHEHEFDLDKSFLLGKAMKVIKTEAGEMRVLPYGRTPSDLRRKKIGLGFLQLEPKALLLPHYIDAQCLFLVHKGRGRLSWVDNGSSQEVELEEGDVFNIENGLVFHIYNSDEGQRLSIFGIFDTSTVYTEGMFHNFFVAGGQKPTTVLSGFSEDVLAAVFKAPIDEIRDIFSSQTEGAIIYSTQNVSKRQSSLGNLVTVLDKVIGLPNIFPGDSRNKPYNLLKKKPDFSNDYGSTMAIHGDDFEVLKEVDKGAFLVRLKAGAVLAPHWNPRAMEIALVTKGEGVIQIVYPNGTVAATEQVREGNVFYVPQHFPMCQIASRSGPFEFMGFSTSSRSNRPQFLVGSNAVLKAVDREVLAAAFNLPSQRLEQFLDLQPDSVILPGEQSSPSASTFSFLSRTRKERTLS